MNCQRCQSKRIVEVNAKCSDLFSARFDTNEYDGYVPQDLGIGSGDYIGFHYCMECGQLQGNFPMGGAAIEKVTSYEEVLNFFKNHFSEGESIDGINPSYQRLLLKEAQDMGPQFHNFLKYFFLYNQGRKFVAAERFATMYTDSSPCMENGEGK